MQVSLLQCQSSRSVSDNLAFIESQLSQLPRKVDEPQLVVLPECCLLFGGQESQQLQYAVDAKDSKLKHDLAKLAALYRVVMVAGSIPILAEDGRVYNRCYVFDADGSILGQYDKLHLFDVEVSDGTKQYRESDAFCPGKQIVVVDTPMGKLGLAICYDIRFPDLFRALREAGAEMIAVPAAFTKVTGEAHWQVLLQARAIETQCFVLGAAQWGQHNQGSRETWGQSMIVGPWGNILAQKAQGTGWIQAEIELQSLQELRAKMPVMTHNRFVSPKLK
ncbi:Nitrilase/cyanide hydratase and apolipoprotein N-acyltransferase [Shewanella halifaxensis HAW-EB4]|uniref:Nitrilase/cyanide hydratase and apolipoprotein N-acyltransferase n=1 Tax=Shewanella halifaxensis (strain HAW-EB4) TaxID=458817 RepID=B0TVS0_SHEHH|nr:carbon-nitrogen hydrolase family protein [Shewanella halifaxensis]ABZ78373.1 Nitrilase/cyanide hydratase and apolipoprotein N-acyltransferase [Shewanella halifaxensis HAW-EB4]